MAIFTKNDFFQIARNYAGYDGVRGMVNEKRLFSKTSSNTTLFLSHSHKDKEVVEQAKIFFEHLGIKIYVDWADQTMPEKTDGVIAQKI